MDLTDRINTARVDEHTTLLKSLNIVSETLEADSTLKATMQAMAETNTTTSSNITSLTELLRNAKLPEILTQLNDYSELLKVTYKTLQDSLRLQITDTSKMKEMVTEMFQAFKGFSSSTSSGEPQPMVTDEAKPEVEVEKEHVVKEVASEAEVDPKALCSLKGGKELKLEKITDIHIHPNTKPVAITAIKNNDQRNFDVHKPFKFGDFDVTEWDKLGAIIPKNKNKVVEEPITSLSKKYKRLKEIPGELIINPSLPPHEQVTSLSSSIKRKALELEPEAFQRISDIHKVEVESLLGSMVMAGNVNTPKN
ncbi:hypothetical protein Tco_0863448 [Tanacetum coccineum]